MGRRARDASPTRPADAVELEQTLTTAGNWRVAPKGQGLGAPHGVGLGFVFAWPPDPASPPGHFSGGAHAAPERQRPITAAMHGSAPTACGPGPPPLVAEGPDRAEWLLWDAAS
ncbi:hypothetical protein AB0A77_13720 [Streptomyces varsoviensis]|uniref:hypothetical protein n=1 Tax=Streptomyces varsoviensis TaxID=67373 RepID=UPI0033CA1A1F